ncbi:conserved membrane hypothetical protein [uncultured delta proteobacterium]|uniref:Probable membrane transporter protein n=1 Tax=uncultured delta proteobacterium TaxID=34034 RepID=A0A212KAE6_9DELT|nr:conserved membrane hypothetical protein [uncultured delta proteobacterium]
MAFSLAAYMILGLAAFTSGIAKTGVPGLAILGVVLVPLVIPAKLSTGYVLPFLIFADVLAVIYWRKAAVWRHIIAVLPSMFLGIVIGYLLMDRIDDAVYGKVLGAIVVFILSLDWARRRFELSFPVDSRLFAWSMGFLAGLMTMLANAAGPVMMIYLLAMNISKEEFVGTNAWLYFIVNLSKVPFSISLGLITPDSFLVNAFMLPCVIAGGAAGVLIMRAIPDKTFTALMRFLAFAGGVKLFF